jgi:hypothetical protein
VLHEMMSSNKPSEKGTMQSTEMHSTALPKAFWNAAKTSTGSKLQSARPTGTEASILQALRKPKSLLLNKSLQLNSRNHRTTAFYGILDLPMWKYVLKAVNAVLPDK